MVVMCLQICFSNMAPEAPPTHLPEGWCVGGTPTRTTGECVCLNACEGKGCVHAGIIFYKYDDCPTCKCVQKILKVDLNNPNTVTKTILGHGQEATGEGRNEKEQGLMPHEIQAAGLAHTYVPTNPDEPLSMEEWLEESGRYIAAFAVSVIFISAIVLSVMGQIGSDSTSSSAASARSYPSAEQVSSKTN